MPDIDRLKLAFAVSLAKAVVDADERTDYAEFKLFGQLFPRHLLEEHGFVDADGMFTEALAEAWLEARQVLPGALSEEDKLDVLALFQGVSLADDEVDARERDVVEEAAELLGVSIDAVSRHLAAARSLDD